MSEDAVLEIPSSELTSLSYGFKNYTVWTDYTPTLIANLVWL